MDPLHHSLLLAFDSDTGEFARGFESGRLWALLQAQPDEEIEQLIHGANAEMALRMAEAQGRKVTGTEVDETWIKLLFGPAGSGNWSDV